MLAIVAVPAAMATDLTVSGVTINVSDKDNIIVTTSPDLPFLYQSKNGLTQEFDAFDISSHNSVWWNGLGSADIAVQFSFTPTGSSGPIDGEIEGLFCLGLVTWENGGTTIISDTNGATYILTLENTIYGICNDDVEASLTQVPEPGSMLLLGSGLLAAAGIIRRRLRL